MALPFLCVTLLRLVALRQIVAGSGAAARAPGSDAARLADHSLPVYSVLVPLLREGNVLAGLVQSLHALDYPAAKLDVLLMLETDDARDAGGAAGDRPAGEFSHHHRAGRWRRRPSRRP